MTKLCNITLSAAASGALLAGALMFSPAANAVTTPTATEAMASDELTKPLDTITPAQLDHAIEEAGEAGYVKKQTENADGSRTTTLDVGQGFVFDVIQEGTPQARLGAGTDSYGAYVSFNSTDQNMIISGATFGIAAGLCVVSAGVFCVVAGAILTVATVALTQNGGVRCGTKAMRVYPFSGHEPRCA
jgi:hypothetical protein